MRSAGMYLAATLLLLRLAERLGPLLEAPDYLESGLALCMIAGFPVFLFLVWRSAPTAQDEKPGDAGKKKRSIDLGEDERELGLPIPPRTRILDIALVVLVLAVAYLYSTASGRR